MRKIFIYHHAGKIPYQVKVYHPATMYQPGFVEEIAVGGTPIRKLKNLLTEMYKPCDIFTVEIFEENNAGDKRN